MRTAIPRPFLAYYPAVVKQVDIDEQINFLNGTDGISSFGLKLVESILSGSLLKVIATERPNLFGYATADLASFVSTKASKVGVIGWTDCWLLSCVMLA